MAERALATLSAPREEVLPEDLAQCAWCELCAHFATCPACHRVAVSAAEAGLSVGGTGKAPKDAGVVRAEALPDVPVIEQMACWSDMPSERKAQLMVIAEFAAKWADAVRAKAKADMLAGEAIADPAHGIAYALRETRGRLKLDCDALWAAAKGRGVSAAAFRGCLRPDATEAKQVLRAAGLSAKAADEVLEACGTRGAPSAVLARA